MNISERLVKRSFTRKSIVFRVIAGIILVYFSRIVQVSFFMGWSLYHGIYWGSGFGGSLFPIPTEPGILAVIVPANLVDSLIFGILINSGMWILIVVILVLYIISPVTISIDRKNL